MHDVGKRILNVPFDLARWHTRQRLNDTVLGTYCNYLSLTRLAEEPQQCVMNIFISPKLVVQYTR